jgi:hypothetical protein
VTLIFDRRTTVAQPIDKLKGHVSRCRVGAPQIVGEGSDGGVGAGIE